MLRVCRPLLSLVCWLWTWGGRHFSSLPTGCTIHPRVSEHRGHCSAVIIIQNHATAEPDARATWGHSQVLEGDGRGDDNLKRGRFGRGWGEKGRGCTAALPRPCYSPLCTEKALPHFHPQVRSFPSLQPPRAPGSLRMRLSFKPVSPDPRALS